MEIFKNERKVHTIEKKKINQITIKNRNYINFTSNDYLGISNSSEVINAYRASIKEFGLGSTSSPLLVGYNYLTETLEQKFAKFLNREAAIYFNNGYQANLGVITTLCNRNSRIFADKLCHASIIDGILLSRSKHLRFEHNNLSSLNNMFSKYKSKSNFIITESVFSMEGKMAPIEQISNFATNKKAILIVDDAHGVGILGNRGGGITEKYNLSMDAVPVLVQPLGKAFGSMGAIVSGSKTLINLLRQKARAYMYSTANPPSILQATITALDIITKQQWRRIHLEELIEHFIKEAIKYGLNVNHKQTTPIIPIIFKNTEKAIYTQNKLREYGFWVGAILPPTVPVNKAIIRITLNCFHLKKEISSLIRHLSILLN